MTVKEPVDPGGSTAEVLGQSLHWDPLIDEVSAGFRECPSLAAAHVACAGAGAWGGWAIFVELGDLLELGWGWAATSPEGWVPGVGHPIGGLKCGADCLPGAAQRGGDGIEGLPFIA